MNFPPPVNYFTHAPAGYAMPLSCPRCGSTMDHVASSVPYAGTEASAIARCSRHGCHYEFQVMVHVRPVGTIRDDRTQLCGTMSGYREHFRRGEPACDACNGVNAWSKTQASLKRKANA